MKMSKKERAVLKAIVALQEAGGSSFTLESISEYVYSVPVNGESLKKPVHWEHAMASTLRNLAKKVPRNGCTLKRTSELGRENKGVYSVTGNYRYFFMNDPVVLSTKCVPETTKAATVQG